MSTARLLISCPDRPGIVAAVTGFLFSHGANITELDQHSTDPQNGTFFMRLVFQIEGFALSREGLEKAFQEIASRFSMSWTISYSDDIRNMAILVSREDHALLELLWRVKRSEIKARVAMVISNHEDLRQDVEQLGIPFNFVPSSDRQASERSMLQLLENVDLVVLARYMRLLSPEFVDAFPNRIINIHHSFLPSFAGANPYRQAYQRGVKLIGATAHYVTAGLDSGPIVEQDVIRVSHRHSVNEMVELGRDIEKQVLARAVKWHLEDRIIVFQNKTVVFL
ncbi:MAG: formyltetrahydrofolate deformylase [Candidatus Diapherotrites archaeon]|uniref:Formyltetrahydrofolate deformylase n=1 Tax=Candidatus Iainarchaeum sp. TaxID=3101447 RepID=A0A8T3YM21_9ARCH|nr:formyltetrahydrofolate deformylase [Candidatus Diapherotrites archaeon]